MVLTAVVGSLWCIVGAAWITAQWRETDELARAARMEVFVQTDSTHDRARALAVVARRINGVSAVTMTESADVYASLMKDLELSEADLAGIVQLPDQLTISVVPEHCTVADLTLIAASITRTSPDVVRVVQPLDYVQMVERRRTDLFVLGGVASVLSAIMFIIAIFYAFRAEVHAAAGDLTIGRALGAGTWFMATPHILVSLVAGGLGLAAGMGLVIAAWPELVTRVVQFRFTQLQDIYITTGAVAIVGVMLTAVQSWWAVRRAVRKA
jgi:cell division protein FtsX